MKLPGFLLQDSNGSQSAFSCTYSNIRSPSFLFEVVSSSHFIIHSWNQQAEINKKALFNIVIVVFFVKPIGFEAILKQGTRCRLAEYGYSVPMYWSAFAIDVLLTRQFCKETFFCSFGLDDPFPKATTPHLSSVHYFLVFRAVLPLLCLFGQETPVVRNVEQYEGSQQFIVQCVFRDIFPFHLC
jgi:hypothetical protein